MTRLATVLFVALAVQFSAATAPFVHAHGKAAHPGDHEHASVVHRHLAPHAEPGDHHDDEHDEGEPDGHRVLGLSVSSAAVFTAAGLTTRHQTRTALNAPVTPVVAIQAPAPGTAPPDHDVGRPIPHAPDLTSSPLRGPPR